MGTHKFFMDTDWIFQGVIDSEQKQYVLLDYFKKLNVEFELLRLYPMFIELSLHLGNIQTLISQNKLLYTDKKILRNDEELLLSDLKTKEIPVIDNDEIDEYKKILKLSLSQFHDYFDFAKSLWSVVYDSIGLRVIRNQKNLKSKKGFLYYILNDIVYIWGYNIRKVYNVDNEYKTTIKKVYEGKMNDMTIHQLISNNSSNYVKNKENTYPVFEFTSQNEFPLYETLLPIFKRKLTSFINQRNENKY